MASLLNQLKIFLKKIFDFIKKTLFRKKPSIEDAEEFLFGKSPQLEKDNDKDFKRQLLEQYKVAVDSLFRTLELLLMINRYNLYINVLIITGLSYCILQGSFIWAVPLLYGFGILLSFNWYKVDRHYQDWLAAQELICRAIEEKLSCPLVSAGKEFHAREQGVITICINWLHNFLRKLNLPKILFVIYILGLVFSL